MERILVFTATYNEAGNIGRWIDEVHEQVPGADLLIVDDSSPDGTARIIADARDAGRPVTLIERPGKQGLGSAHQVAFAYALEHGYDVLVTMDADLSHRPVDVPAVIAASAGADFVIGTRSHGGHQVSDGMRKALTGTANTVTAALLPTGLTEYTTSLRAFRPRALSVLVGPPLTARGYAFFIECIEALHAAGVSMTEVPIVFVDRTHGRSKIPRDQIFWTGLLLLRLKADRVTGRDRTRYAPPPELQ